MGKPHREGDQSCELARILLIARAAALAVGASEHEAQEVAQTTAVKLWEKWGSHHVRRARRWDRDRWESYIRTAARNRHYDLVRGHQRRIDRQRRAADPTRAGEHPAHAGGPNPMEGIETFLARTAIAQEIDRLPAGQRQVAARIYLEDRSIAEVALELQIQPQSVRKRLKAARAALRRALGEDDR